ncbi:hypothetical protein ON010_g12583 [Phytophthora cinnamomi]|nr:hypothetical protein ON010_g12583 [Phytophthora cinnamomi]
MTRSEDAKEAARTRDDAWFQRLSRGRKDEIMLEGVLAAEKGDFELVRGLLEELEEYQEFDNDDHTEEWRILEEAAANGHLKIVELLIERLDDNGERESCGYEKRAPGGREEALTRAISAGHYEVVDRLLNPYLFDWDLVLALEQALDQGKENIAELIYKVSFEFHHVSTQCVQDYEYILGPLGDLLVQVARRGRLDLVEYVYKKREPSTKVVDLAFHEAAKCGHIDVLDFLLSAGRVTTNEFESVFCGAARAGSIKLVKFLHNKSPPSADLMAKAFEGTRSIEVMKYLSRKMFVSTNSIVRTFQNASANGLGEISGFLCSTGCVPIHMIRKAFVRAAACRSAGVVRALRRQMCIGPNEIIEAFCGANDLHVVEILYAESYITHEMVMQCFLKAARVGETDIVKFLFEKKQISDATVRDTFYDSITTGDFITTRCLFNLPCILHEDRATAFIAAARHGRIHSIEGNEDWSDAVLREALNVSTSDTRRFLLQKLQQKRESRTCTSATSES